MGIRERRQRQKETLRSGILAAAREVASTEGWRAVTIRKIAAAVEYSPPVVYEYFNSKEDLLLELVKMGYAKQLEAIVEARDAAGDPEKALFGMSRAWCRFAFEAPDLYQAMYGLGGISFPVTELKKEGEKIAETIAEVLSKILANNGKETKDVWTKVTLAWATFHGIVALAMAGRLPGGYKEAEKLTDQAARDLLSAWLKT